MGLKAFPCVVARLETHDFLFALARSNFMPARPYIDRLIVFKRFTCPSTGPLLHCSVIAASTAFSSCRRLAAKFRSSGESQDSASFSQSASGLHDCFRNIETSSPARSNADPNSGIRSRRFSKTPFAFTSLAGFMNEKESLLAVGGLGHRSETVRS